MSRHLPSQALEDSGLGRQHHELAHVLSRWGTALFVIVVVAVIVAFGALVLWQAHWLWPERTIELVAGGAVAVVVVGLLAWATWVEARPRPAARPPSARRHLADGGGREGFAG